MTNDNLLAASTLADACVTLPILAAVVYLSTQVLSLLFQLHGHGSATRTRCPTTRERNEKILREDFFSLHEYTAQELGRYDGVTSDRAMMSLAGKVFDISTDDEWLREFAGKEFNMKEAESISCSPDHLVDIFGKLNFIYLDSLSDWEDYFIGRYQIVGQLVPKYDPKPLELLCAMCIRQSLKGGDKDIEELALPNTMKRKLSKSAQYW